MTQRERTTAALPPHVLLLVAVFAIAIFDRGGYYPPARTLLAVGLVLATVTAVRARGIAWRGLPQAAIALCGALAAWALLRAVIGGTPGDASGYVLMLAGVAAVIFVCSGTTWAERDLLLDAVIALAVVAALSGIVGVAWHYSAWAIGDTHLWRATTTVTYQNAAAGLLVPIGLLALGRLAEQPRSRVRSAAACVVLAGATATLSRAGALSFVVGAVVLAGFIGPRRCVRAAGPPLLGAAIAFAGLLPSIAHSHPSPAIAVFALVVGVVAAAGLADLPARRTGRGGVIVAVAAVLALGAGVAAGGGLARIRADRLSFGEVERGPAATAALRIVERHPVAGVGPRHARLVWATPFGGRRAARYAHNEYLQVLAELGAVGLALLVGLIAALARQLWLARGWAASQGVWVGSVAAIFAAVVHGGFDFLWHVPAVVLVCAALAGVAGTRETATTVATQRHRRAPLRKQQPEGSVVT